MNEIEKLRQVLEHIPEGRDRTLALSIIACWEASQFLTADQAYWTNKLVEEYKPPEVVDLGGSLAPIVALMRLGLQSKLEAPSILLRSKNGQPARLYFDKDTGVVRVYSNGYRGSISPEGLLTSPQPLSQDIVDTLREFARDPQQAITAYGKLTGRCCFCGRRLNDPPSIHAGYGPTCAERYKLPWGEISPLQQEAIANQLLKELE
jgi:hypothetical protein